MYVHAIYVPVAALLAAENALAGGSLPTPDVACRKIVQIFILQGIEWLTIWFLDLGTILL